MSSGDWLATHYRAKSGHRLKQLSQLPIKSGSKVLDLCCGSGLFEPYLLDLVGPKGHVTGLDMDPVSLDSVQSAENSTPD
ncbi:MAG: methyltransferase domain-containing protein [Pseudomonadota bacterium]